MINPKDPVYPKADGSYHSRFQIGLSIELEIASRILAAMVSRRENISTTEIAEALLIARKLIEESNKA